MKLLVFNVQNKYRLEDYNGIYRNKDTVKALSSFTKEHDIDILCLQEVVENYRNRLAENLKDYKFYGKPRIGNNFFTKHIAKLKKFNESVNIFTNLKVNFARNIKLPNLPDFIPRVATLITVSTSLGDITIINIHLSAYNKISKRRQLKYILKIISNLNTKVILTGDFNMNVKSSLLNKFIDRLNKIGINHLKITEKTFKKSKCNLPIDHIFLSNNLKVIKLEVIKNDIKFSDHYPILLEL